MIDVDYNEYKKTIAENMKLIVENNRLKEVEKEHQKLNGELREEIERLKNMIKAEEKISNLLPDETDFIIVRRGDYNRLFGSDKE